MPLTYRGSPPTGGRRPPTNSRTSYQTHFTGGAGTRRPSWLQTAANRINQAFSGSVAGKTANALTPIINRAAPAITRAFNTMAGNISPEQWSQAMSGSPALMTPSTAQYAHAATGNYPDWIARSTPTIANRQAQLALNPIRSTPTQNYATHFSPTSNIPQWQLDARSRSLAYLNPNYVPGVNTAQQMPEKVYRRAKLHPPTYGAEAYPQGYANTAAPMAQSGGYAGYGDYGYGQSYGKTYADTAYTGPVQSYRQRGQLPYMQNMPRWLQGLVTWRF